MISTRIESMDKDIQVFINENLSPAAQRVALAGFALEALAEAQNVNKAALGYVPRHDTYVDGRKGASVSSVQLNGVIVFDFALAFDVLKWIDALLIVMSPVKSGAYQKSHKLFLDGIESEPADDLPFKEAVFANSRIYARKLEKGDSAQAPNGIYQGVAYMAQRRFGLQASIRYRISTIFIEDGRQRQPSIVVTLKD